MRKLMFLFGRIASKICPYNLYIVMIHLIQWFYTGYRFREFKHFGKGSKLSSSMHIAGGQHIIVGNNVLIGGGLL